MNILDKLWLKANKTPPGKPRVYIGIIFPWVVSGLLILLIAFAITGTLEGILPPEPLIPLVLLLVVYVGLSITIDSKWGYIDAIYQHSLKRWKEHRKRLLGEE